MSDSLLHHGLQHARSPVLHHLPEFAQVHIHWVHDAIQPFHPLSPLSLPALHFFPASGSFAMSWFFTSGGQSIRASASVLQMNIQGWFPLGWTDFICLLSKGFSVFLVQFSHPYVTTGKSIALTIWTFVGKVMSLLSNMLSTFLKAFLPRSKCLLIFWLQSPSAVIGGPRK